MAAPIQIRESAPYAVPAGETNDDTITASDGNVEIVVEIKLVGSVAQVQADYATLAGTSVTSPSATISWAGE